MARHSPALARMPHAMECQSDLARLLGSGGKERNNVERWAFRQALGLKLALGAALSEQRALHAELAGMSDDPVSDMLGGGL